MSRRPRHDAPDAAAAAAAAAAASRVPQRASRRPTRSAGVLLHVTSLPGPHGIGALGPFAYRWVDALARAGQTWWQILPLGPPGKGYSPYQSYSAFAGNPMLISPELLVREGLLHQSDLSGAPAFPDEQVDFPRVARFKARLLGAAWQRFKAGPAGASLKGAFDQFCAERAAWLDDHALFMALRDASGRRDWVDWPKELVLRKTGAIASARRELADAVGRERFAQFLFHRQWDALLHYAHARGVKIIGDLPIYVSPESSDVWASPHLFELDRHTRRPLAVAGVPPDMFSATGQRWGNPLYDWEAMRRDGYAWWVRRLRASLAQVDLLRIDHFRGFAAYWRVPASATAMRGRWVNGPGIELFGAMRRSIGGLPLIAEDLGVITPDVERLRDNLDLPGMRIIQFGFGGNEDAENPYLPHNYVQNAVVYTGTHDNDTTAGWYASLTRQERAAVRRYVPDLDERQPALALLRLAWSSVADYAIAPLQDVLGLGSAARMNIPGRARKNWGWRAAVGMIGDRSLGRLGELTRQFARVDSRWRDGPRES